jgi:hypothetical protein
MQLHNANLFALAVLDQANIISPIPKAKDWREIYLKQLMLNLEEIEPLESLNSNEQLENLLYDFTVHRAQARTKEDILNKAAWTDDDKKITLFKMDDFFAFAKRNNWEMDKTKTGNLLKQLKDIFVEEVRLKIKNQTPRLVKIKAMKRYEPDVSQKPYEEEVPF